MREMEPQLTPLEIKEKKVIETIKPFIDQIEKERLREKVELGGYILEGEIYLKKGLENKVDQGSFEEVRELAEKGALFFHTHPSEKGKSVFEESALDIISTYVALGEVLFCDKGIFLLLPVKKLPIEEIKRIDEEAWKKAQESEFIHGDPAYWFWKDTLTKEMPIKKIKIKEKG